MCRAVAFLGSAGGDEAVDLGTDLKGKWKKEKG
jgi:hypothetical protein